MFYKLQFPSNSSRSRFGVCLFSSWGEWSEALQINHPTTRQKQQTVRQSVSHIQWHHHWNACTETILNDYYDSLSFHSHISSLRSIPFNSKPEPAQRIFSKQQFSLTFFDRNSLLLLLTTRLPPNPTKYTPNYSTVRITLRTVFPFVNRIPPRFCRYQQRNSATAACSKTFTECAACCDILY